MGVLLAFFFFLPKVGFLHLTLITLIFIGLSCAESKIDDIKTQHTIKVCPWLKMAIVALAFMAICSLHTNYFDAINSIIAFFRDPEKHLDTYIHKIFRVALLGLFLFMGIYYHYKEKE